MSVNALLIASDAAATPEEQEREVERQKERRLYVLVFDQLMDGKPRRWLDHDLEKSWESW